MVAIKDPELVTLKNVRKAVRGVAAEDPSNKVIRIVNDKQAEEIRRMLRLTGADFGVTRPEREPHWEYSQLGSWPWTTPGAR